MFTEKNTGTNLPAQLDLYATDGARTNSSSSPKAAARRTNVSLYQETRAVLNPKSIVKFFSDKMARSAPPRARPIT
jgi:fumarate hydratase class I